MGEPGPNYPISAPHYKYHKPLWDPLFFPPGCPFRCLRFTPIDCDLILIPLIPNILIKSVISLVLLSVGFVQATPPRCPRE